MADLAQRTGADLVNRREDELQSVRPSTPMTVDQLDYLADLVAELREMAHKSGMEMLASILGLAETETKRQIAERKP